VAGQQVGHRAGFAPTHGVGLAGQRERAHAGLADGAGGEVQVDQRGAVGRAVGRLVESLAPERERRLGLAEPARGGDDVVGLDAADGGDGARRQLGELLAQVGEAGGVFGDEGVVNHAFPQQHVQHR
jgi:hypothetical protein